MATKWADYLISAVSKDFRGNITHVKLHVDNGDTVAPGEKKSESEVIALLKLGKKIFTITKGQDNKWSKGAEVIYAKTVNHVEYLKTESNATTKDNLDNLPLMD